MQLALLCASNTPVLCSRPATLGIPVAESLLTPHQEYREACDAMDREDSKQTHRHISSAEKEMPELRGPDVRFAGHCRVCVCLCCLTRRRRNRPAAQTSAVHANRWL